MTTGARARTACLTVAVLLTCAGVATQGDAARADDVPVMTRTTPSPNVVEGLEVPAPGAHTVVAGPVLPPLDPEAAEPRRRALQARLDAIATSPQVGSDAAYVVLDASTGARLAARRPTSARVPASTAKLLTGAAALSVLGPQSALRTKVVDGAAEDEIVLVGGGDVLLRAGASRPGEVLGHAGLTTLARRTAAELRAQGRTTVAVRLDDSIFSGPAVSPRWSPTDVAHGYVAPITPLAVEAGAIGKGVYPPRSPDPAMSAAKTFARLLEKQPGIDVTGDVSRTRTAKDAAEPDADELAAVESAPVGDVVEYMLQHSDNTVAEVLARLVARAEERPATFGGAGAAVLDRVALLGVDVQGARLTGGSGLGTGSALTPVTLAAVLRAATSSEHPELRPLLSGMPIAAATGTLAVRFDDKDNRPARGVLRAKTGTLTGVHSLAGTVVDADGRLLIFAVLAGGANALAARDALDDLGTRLAACGCR